VLVTYSAAGASALRCRWLLGKLVGFALDLGCVKTSTHSSTWAPCAKS